MRFRLAALFIGALIQIGNSAMAQEEITQSVASLPPVTILGTQLQHITSTITGEEYDLYINLPRNYQDQSRTFPVLYLLDGQWDFPLVMSVFGEQYYDGFVPEIVIVGITWRGSNLNYDSLRVRDFTPTTVPQLPHSGNALKFLEFIKKELIPFIEANYRVVPNDRTLVGSSLGGLFTLYALFYENELFNRYILTSPSLQWDNGVLYNFEKSFAVKKSPFPIKLYMAIGEYEGTADFQKFVNHLKERNNSALTLTTRVLDGIGHSGTKAEGYARGLQTVFARPSIRVNPSLLAPYVGSYQINPQLTIKVFVEDDQLVALTPDSTKIILFAETATDFYIKGAYLFVHFKKDETGSVNGFQLQQFNGEMFCKKLIP